MPSSIKRSPGRSVNVFNRTRLRIAAGVLKKNILYLWKKFFPDIRRGEVNFIFTGDSVIRKLNSRYLKRKNITDVIYFYYLTPQPLNKKYGCSGEIDGDVFVSARQARRQSEIYGWGFNDEITLLSVHGFLHVIGYRDYTDKEKKQMRLMEKKLLAALKIPDGRGKLK